MPETASPESIGECLSVVLGYYRVGRTQIFPQDNRVRPDDQDCASPSPVCDAVDLLCPDATSDGMPDSAGAAVEHTRQELAPHRRPPGDIELFSRRSGGRGWLVSADGLACGCGRPRIPRTRSNHETAVIDGVATAQTRDLGPNLFADSTQNECCYDDQRNAIPTSEADLNPAAVMTLRLLPFLVPSIA